MNLKSTFRDKRVLVTGHTGFKGSWLCEWLIGLGARVSGLALPPPEPDSLFDQLELAGRVNHDLGDIRDLATVQRIVADAQPQFVFHLAAQPLVRRSYEQPVETFATNVLGTVHVLDAIRVAGRPCTVIVVTSDKCYENREWVHSYRETDRMGGHDPYSSSKGAVELIVSAYRRSYFAPGRSPIQLASARAGNVIGGGDEAADRIVPDAIRALRRGRVIAVRNRHATRPWQHVLEPLSGYLQLAAHIQAAAEQRDTAALPRLCDSFNFGPAQSDSRTVAELVEEILKHWPGRWEDQSDPSSVHEAHQLRLAIDKAEQFLHWRPKWDFAESVARTVMWYRHATSPQAAQSITRTQIEEYGEGREQGAGSRGRVTGGG